MKHFLNFEILFKYFSLNFANENFFSKALFFRLILFFLLTFLLIKIIQVYYNPHFVTEAALRRLSIKWMFLKLVTIQNETLTQLFFSVNFTKFFRTPFLQSTFRQLLLSLLLETQSFEFLFLTPNFSRFLFINILVHLAYIFVILIRWLRLYQYILTLTQFVLISPPP